MKILKKKVGFFSFFSTYPASFKKNVIFGHFSRGGGAAKCHFLDFTLNIMIISRNEIFILSIRIVEIPSRNAQNLLNCVVVGEGRRGRGPVLSTQRLRNLNKWELLKTLFLESGFGLGCVKEILSDCASKICWY